MTTAKRLPDFCIIGSQKAGTSSLWHVLRQHPELFLPQQKELNFFFRDQEYKRGDSAYASHFESAGPQQLCGEASPGYLCHPMVPGRMARLIPNAKLIVVLRDPIERAYSQYWDNRRWLMESDTFEELLKRPMHQVFTPGKRNYFSRGCYSIYLERVYQYYESSQVHVVWFAELKSQPEKVYRAIFKFLGVDDAFDVNAHLSPVNRRSVFKNPLYLFVFHRPKLARLLPRILKRLLRFGGQRAYRPEPITDGCRVKLREFYWPFDQALIKLVGRQLPWLDERPPPADDQ